ncbi:MOSC domain-containing protein [Paraglaciecola arctica]|uniref:MOSC domain-containing protein n=1 Tax=Paraglaciecola arctica BSs20135 TaxID=493475 RepID=K6YDI2_9ALTE|nr:MOSC domain-containing protein [Paraglaciecola arctica]GAC22011.1 MOSC domain-containing protein [Paraglaciecola arctica BSs20135]
MQLLDIAFRTKSRAPMETKVETMVSKVAGVEDDFRGKPGKRQVTVLSLEQWQLACDELGTSLPWTVRRANLLLEGVSFDATMLGKQIKIGQLILLITRETDPCPRMDAQHQGLTEALTPDWRGGVCCRVIADGRVKIGDKIEIFN